MNEVLAINQLTVRRGQQAALQDISFSLKAGTDVAIIGPNGAGKSTLSSGDFRHFAARVWHSRAARPYAGCSPTDAVGGSPSGRLFTAKLFDRSANSFDSG